MTVLYVSQKGSLTTTGPRGATFAEQRHVGRTCTSEWVETPLTCRRAHPVSVYSNGSFMVAGCWLQQSGPGALLSLSLSLSLSLFFSPSMINGPIAGLNYFLQISFRALKKRSTLFIHFTFAPSFNIFVYACKNHPSPPPPHSQEKEGKKAICPMYIK